jgi:dUTP pyrophosphatase
MRKFQKISKYKDVDLLPPSRATKYSAAYDLPILERTTILSGEIVYVPTGYKVYMEQDEYLMLVLRSSIPKKYQLCIPNGIGIIDSDYVDNPTNEGQIFISLENRGDKTLILEANQIVAQAIFTKYYLTDDDAVPNNIRAGGFGSTRN